MNKYSSKNIFFIVLFASFVFSSQIFAQNSSKSFLIKPWAVGQFITFRTQNYANDQLSGTNTTTYSIVGQETIKDKNYFWVEIENDNQDGTISLKKIQIRQPQAIEFNNTFGANVPVLMPRRVIAENISPGSSNPTPVESPVPQDWKDEVENDPAPSETVDYSTRYVAQSPETLTVPAGTFVSFKLHRDMGILKDAASVPVTQFLDAWGDPQIPVWGLVQKIQQRWDSDHKVILRWNTQILSYGDSGATSKINEISPQLITPTPVPKPVAGPSKKPSPKNK